MFTGSVTANIIHGRSGSPLGALDWSLGEFASTFAIAEAWLFLTSLCLHKAVSVFSIRCDSTILKYRRRRQHHNKIPMVTLWIYRITGVLLLF